MTWAEGTRKRSAAAGHSPDVTTVVVSRDRRDDLLNSLSRQSEPVIYIDNGSRDGSPAAVRAALPYVRVVQLGRNIGAAARNAGVRMASTPYVAFADDDSWWAPGALARCAEHFDRHPRLGLVAARILVGDSEEEDPVCRAMAESPLPRTADLPGPPVLGFVACGAVVRRTAFLDVGGFDRVVFFAGEEDRVAIDLASAGWGLAYVADVVAHHHPSPRREHRDLRESRLARSALLTAVMRRPWSVVRRLAVGYVRQPGAARAGAVSALAQAGPALRRRRPAPEEVEGRLAALRNLSERPRAR